MPGAPAAAEQDFFAISDDEVERIIQHHHGDCREAVREQALTIARLERQVSDFLIKADKIKSIPVYRMFNAPRPALRDA